MGERRKTVHLIRRWYDSGTLCGRKPRHGWVCTKVREAATCKHCLASNRRVDMRGARRRTARTEATP